jgi:uncharacterized protein (TIGR02266 family)
VATRKPTPSRSGGKKPRGVIPEIGREEKTNEVTSPRGTEVTPNENTPTQNADPTNELTLGEDPANRRRSARIPLRVWAENRGFEEFCLWLAAEDISRDFAFCYRTTDLSSEGVFLETTTPLEIGVEMDLTFKLPGSERIVHAYGEVVRVVKRGGKKAPGMAVAFKDMDPASRASLDAFLISRD